MNAELQKIHIESLKNKTALLTYRSMCRDYRKDRGTLTSHAELLIYNIAYLDDLMESLRTDLSAHGTVKTVKNGRQEYSQQNKSIGDLSRLMERQARLIARLGLKKNDGEGAAGDGETVEEGLDNF